MNHLIKADDFLNFANAFNSQSGTNQSVFEKLVAPAFQASPVYESQQGLNSIVQHTNFLLNNFDSFQEMITCENVLVRNGYDPIFLALEGGYFEILEAVKSLNESVWDSVKSALNAITDNGDPLAIFQLFLDLLGIIPFDLGTGIPVNEIANIANACIYFFGPKPNYILGLLSLGMGIPGIGTIVFAPIKAALLPFTHILAPLGKWIFLGEKPGMIKAIQELKAAPGASSIIGKLGEALAQLSKYLKTVGLKAISSIGEYVGKAVKFVGGDKLGTKIIDWSTDMNKIIARIASGCDDAGELLLKGDAKVSAAAADARSIAAAANAERTSLNKFLDTPGFTKALRSEIEASAEFQKLAAKSSVKVQEKFIANKMTEKLVNQLVGETTSTSLINVLKNPQIVTTLAKKYGKNAMDDILLKAVSGKNPAEIAKVLEEVLTTPEVLKVISGKTAKTLALFRAHPELLTRGIDKLKKATAAVNSLPATTKIGNIFTRHKRLTGMRLLSFFTKMYVKNSECLKWITQGDYTDVADKAMSHSGNLMPALTESVFKYNRLYEESENTDFSLTPEEISQLKEINPEGYAAYTSQEQSTEKAIEQLAPKDPCGLDLVAAEALASTQVDEKWMSGIYDAHGRGEETDLITVDGKESDSARKMRELSQNYLQAVGEDPNIEPQHPLSKTDPYTKAYLCDVYNFATEEYAPNASEGSRLDPTLDFLIKKGELKPEDREDVKNQTLEHWQNDTMPDEFETMSTTFKGKDDQSALQEKVSNLKVSRVTTKNYSIR